MKIQVKDYTFTASTGEITFTGYASIDLDSVLLVTNVTRNVIIYNFSSPSLGGTVAGNVLTLTFDTSAMADADKLQIFYDDSGLNAQNIAYPSGTGTNASITLTSANTAYSVPASAPATAYNIVLYNGSDTDMFWGYATLTSGGILLPSGGTVSLNLGANQGLFAYCASAGKVLSVSYKLIS